MEYERIEKERSHLIKVIFVAVSGVNVVKDEWIAVAYDRDWYPWQFVKFDEEQEEMQRHFVHRSSSNQITIGLCGQNYPMFQIFHR